MFKKRIRRFFPPVLVDAIHRAQLGLGLVKPTFEVAPLGWRTPLDTRRGQGWNSENVAETEKAKWEIFCRHCEGRGPLGFSHEHADPSQTDGVSFHNDHITYAYVLALAARARNSISILDWGGALGHYYQIGKAVLPELTIEFHCKEVPVLTRLGKELNSAVHWYEDDSCLLRRYDLVMMNGSLPYCEDWKDRIKKMAGSVGGFFYLTRQAVVEQSKSFTAIQRVYGVEMLHWQINKKELLNEVQSHGLELVREFIAGDKILIHRAPEPCALQGFLFKRGSSE